jgi:hypothetical protein
MIPFPTEFETSRARDTVTLVFAVPDPEFVALARLCILDKSKPIAAFVLLTRIQASVPIVKFADNRNFTGMWRPHSKRNTIIVYDSP